jgi:uncharacterized membrane protein YdbT with pleckstrin-like domain
VLTLVILFIQPLDAEAFIGVVVPLGVLIFILFLLVNFRGIKIKIDSEKLRVNYGLLNSKSIMLYEIDSCKVAKAPFNRFGGVGIRYGFDGSYAYTTSFGNAVEITPKKGRTFIFSTNNPDQICEFVNKKKIKAK